MKCRFQVGILEIMSVSKRYLSHVRRAKPRYIEVSLWEGVFTPSKTSEIEIFLFSLKSGQFPMVDGTHLPC